MDINLSKLAVVGAITANGACCSLRDSAVILSKHCNHLLGAGQLGNNVVVCLPAWHLTWHCLQPGSHNTNEWRKLRSSQK